MNKNHTFILQISNNPALCDVKINEDAIREAGAPETFIEANRFQASALNCAVILRSNFHFQHRKLRSPKSGANLSKTSNQGFFKGYIPTEPLFSRIEYCTPNTPQLKPIHSSDRTHLALPPTHPDYQHTRTLDLDMLDILRETSAQGDLDVLGFEQSSGFLRLKYREGKGAPDFKGQFVIQLLPELTSLALDVTHGKGAAEEQWKWNTDKQLIQKPQALHTIPDEIYEACFNQLFYLYYTPTQLSSIQFNELIPAHVFANRPHDASGFKSVVGQHHPYYALIKHQDTLDNIFSTLGRILDKNALHAFILETYDRGSYIATSDWDGIALGQPPDINVQYTQVFNTFDLELGLENQIQLMTQSNAYLQEQKQRIQKKPKQERHLFDNTTLNIENFQDIVSQFSLARAGCITPHEFLFQQLVNHIYLNEKRKKHAAQYDLTALQATLNQALEQIQKGMPSKIWLNLSRNELAKQLKDAKTPLTPTQFDKMVQHLKYHLKIAVKAPDKPYAIPPLHQDIILQGLYQHGFDVRSPYGSNLEGSWLVILPTGDILYGKTQEELVDVILTGDFMEKNYLDIPPCADMSAGWARVVERQKALNQLIQKQTWLNYQHYIHSLNAAGAQENERSPSVKPTTKHLVEGKRV